MIKAHYTCNGCGLWTSYKGKNEKQLNVIQVDLTNYLLFNSGFKLKEPQLDIHLCDECFAQTSDGAARVARLGDTEVMRKKIEDLESTLEKERRRFDGYHAKVKSLLKEPVYEGDW